jgi:hypothetical protein
MKLSLRSFVLVLSTAVATAVPLMAPASASAILVGAESNGELVNSNVTPAAQAQALTKMQKQGVQVVRVNWGWNEVAVGNCATQSLAQLEDPSNACYDWTRLDSLISQANARRIQVLISITRVPAWVSGNGDPLWMGASMAQFNRIKGHYAAFHKAAATRYKVGSPFGTIRYWTIHNEPNSPRLWKPVPNGQRYAALFAAASKAVHAGNPKAVVAAGPTNPTGNAIPAREAPPRGVPGIRPAVFIMQFQKWIPKYLPGKQLRANLNAWAHNPYPSTTSQPTVVAPGSPSTAIGMATIGRLFSTLDRSRSTRGLKVFATEFGWETSGRFRTTPARQSQFLAESFDWLDSRRRVLIGIQYGLTDPTDPVDWQSGTFYANGRAKPAYAMYQRMISVPKAGLSGRVRRNTTVSIWGRGNVNPATGALAYRILGRKCSARVVRVTDYCLVPRQVKRSDRSIRATLRLRVRGTYQFATYSKGNPALGIKDGYGPARTVRVR